MTRLVVRDVSAGYGADRVLDAVELTVNSGELAAVLGASGCGKTTLLRVIAGFHKAAAGSVHLDDRCLASGSIHVPPEKRRIGIVPQDGALFPHLSVADNVGFGLRRDNTRRARIHDMLALVGLAGYARRAAHELSGGEQQRVALARALAPRPDVVLLDEPFAALDAGLRAEVRAQIHSALRAEQVTGVLVTHDQEEALSIADTVAVMRDGRIVQQDDPARVYTDPVDLWVAQFVGDAVVLPASAIDGDRARCAVGEVAVVGDTGQTGDHELMFRPEQLRLAPTGHGVDVLVKDVEYFGHDALVTVTAEGVTMLTRVSGMDIPDIGNTVAIRIEGPARAYVGDQVAAARASAT